MTPRRSLDETLDILATLPAKIESLTARLDELAQKVNAQSVEPLLPLCKILNISTRAALGRLANDAELRALGHRLGRRLVFRPSEVRHLLAHRERERNGNAAEPRHGI
jgi:hypothetical protein